MLNTIHSLLWCVQVGFPILLLGTNQPTTAAELLTDGRGEVFLFFPRSPKNFSFLWPSKPFRKDTTLLALTSYTLLFICLEEKPFQYFTKILSFYLQVEMSHLKGLHNVRNDLFFPKSTFLQQQQQQTVATKRERISCQTRTFAFSTRPELDGKQKKGKAALPPLRGKKKKISPFCFLFPLLLPPPKKRIARAREKWKEISQMKLQ